MERDRLAEISGAPPPSGTAPPRRGPAGPARPRARAAPGSGRPPGTGGASPGGGRSLVNNKRLPTSACQTYVLPQNHQNQQQTPSVHPSLPEAPRKRGGGMSVARGVCPAGACQLPADRQNSVPFRALRSRRGRSRDMQRPCGEIHVMSRAHHLLPRQFTPLPRRHLHLPFASWVFCRGGFACTQWLVRWTSRSCDSST